MYQNHQVIIINYWCSLKQTSQTSILSAAQQILIIVINHSTCTKKAQTCTKMISTNKLSKYNNIKTKVVANEYNKRNIHYQLNHIHLIQLFATLMKINIITDSNVGRGAGVNVYVGIWVGLSVGLGVWAFTNFFSQIIIIINCITNCIIFIIYRTSCITIIYQTRKLIWVWYIITNTELITVISTSSFGSIESCKRQVKSPPWGSDNEITIIFNSSSKSLEPNHTHSQFQNHSQHHHCLYHNNLMIQYFQVFLRVFHQMYYHQNRKYNKCCINWIVYSFHQLRQKSCKSRHV